MCSNLLSNNVSGSKTSRNAFKFGKTYVVRPKQRHQATIGWLHGLGDKGSRQWQAKGELMMPNEGVMHLLVHFLCILMNLLAGTIGIYKLEQPEGPHGCFGRKQWIVPNFHFDNICPAFSAIYNAEIMLCCLEESQNYPLQKREGKKQIQKERSTRILFCM